MKRWKLAAFAAVLAAFVAVPVQASDWCVKDPVLDIQTRQGTFTIYVTEGVLGSQHEATLAFARAGYTTEPAGKASLLVTVYDYIPNDVFGRFPTEMIVSSQPFGGGTIYGTAFGRSGSTMNVSFKINLEKS